MEDIEKQTKEIKTNLDVIEKNFEDFKALITEDFEVRKLKSGYTIKGLDYQDFLIKNSELKEEKVVEALKSLVDNFSCVFTRNIRIEDDE